MACQALIIAAPASGQGKTAITAALAWLYRHQGKNVRVFKLGPDFLDPMILSVASGHTVYQLDLWMMGESACGALLSRAALQADVILIESAMGLFDGPCSAALFAQTFHIPLLLVVDATAMGQTFAAICHGLTHFDPQLKFAGILANRVASPRHLDRITSTLSPQIPFLGALPKDPQFSLPRRHLGLVPAAEIPGLKVTLEALSQHLAPISIPLPTVTLTAAPPPPMAKLLHGHRIAIAKDAAFNFLYPQNLEILEDMGATLVFFSPLLDSALPPADALYLPGGYPELHLDTLSQNHAMKEAIYQHIALQKPLYAECGGMLYLAASLTDHQGKQRAMLGLLPGHGVMQKSLVSLGYQSLTLPTGTLRGHTFHYAQLNNSAVSDTFFECPHTFGPREKFFQLGSITASFVHLHFSHHPAGIVDFFS